MTAADTIGQFRSKFPVELSTRFLEHFSEQLYSSPQKAFEDLISNGWDAGADYVDVRISDDLTAADATMCVLDNGESMDAEGLRQLWHIAFSPKQKKPDQYGRKVIGKFGIGKLATYVLTRKLTYICKAADGVIRRVTMDYSGIDHQSDQDKLMSQLELEIYEVEQAEIEQALKSVYGGDALLKLIRRDVPPPKPSLAEEDEFGSPGSVFAPPENPTLDTCNSSPTLSPLVLRSVVNFTVFLQKWPKIRLLSPQCCISRSIFTNVASTLQRF